MYDWIESKTSHAISRKWISVVYTLNAFVNILAIWKHVLFTVVSYGKKDGILGGPLQAIN